jgi:uncharacterized membrane protein YbaN (DUF454 family)
MLGCAMVALGVIGAFLPLMPSTIFFILAAWFFARSSPRFEAWLLSHKRFGPPLRAWQEERAISRRSKMLAAAGMVLGYSVFFATVRPDWPLGLTVFAAILACAVFVLSRPLPAHERGR